MPTISSSPQFASRTHLSPRFGEAAQTPPTPPNTPNHHSHTHSEVAVEDKFQKEENGSSKDSTPSHTPPASPPAGKVTPEGTEKPKSEKQELHEHLDKMDKEGMKPVFILFAPHDDKDVNTKAGGPHHEKTKWEDLSPAKRFALASMVAVATVVTTIVAGVLYALTAPIRWLFGDKHKQAENKETQTQANQKHARPENTQEKTATEKAQSTTPQKEPKNKPAAQQPAPAPKTPNE